MVRFHMPWCNILCPIRWPSDAKWWRMSAARCSWAGLSPAAQSLFKRLGSHRNSVNALAFAPHGRFLVSGSLDDDDTSTAEIVCWDADAGVERCRTVHPASINALAISPDGRWLAVGDEAGIVTLFPAETLPPSKAVPHSLGAAVTALAYSSDGEQLAVGMVNGQLVLLNRIGDRLAPVGDPISVGADVAAQFGADPRVLYVCTIQHDAGITAWNTDTGSNGRPTVPEPRYNPTLAAPRAGSAIISLTTDGRLTMIPSTQQSVGP